MAFEIVLFPQEIRDLQRELLHPAHTDFNRKFSQEIRPFDEILTDLCTHFGIVVEGIYSPADQLELCKRVTAKLQAARYGEAAEIVTRRH